MNGLPKTNPTKHFQNKSCTLCEWHWQVCSWTCIMATTEAVRSNYNCLQKRKMLYVMVIICQKRAAFISHSSLDRIQIASAIVSFASVIFTHACLNNPFSLKSILAIWSWISYLTAYSIWIPFSVTFLYLPLSLYHALPYNFLANYLFDWSSTFLWGNVGPISLLAAPLNS